MMIAITNKKKRYNRMNKFEYEIDNQLLKKSIVELVKHFIKIYSIEI